MRRYMELFDISSKPWAFGFVFGSFDWLLVSLMRFLLFGGWSPSLDDLGAVSLGGGIAASLGGELARWLLQRKGVAWEAQRGVVTITIFIGFLWGLPVGTMIGSAIGSSLSRICLYIIVVTSPLLALLFFLQVHYKTSKNV